MLAGSTIFSIVAAGFGLTLSMGAVYLAVYGIIQRKNKQKITKKGLTAEAHFANLSAPYMVAGYGFFNTLGSIFSKVLVGFGILIPLSFAIYFPLKYYLHKYSMKKFVKGVFNGDVIRDGYNSLKGNFGNAYKKILKYSLIPLTLFWGLVPAAYQAKVHGILGGISRLFMKTMVDKDIKDIYGKKENINEYNHNNNNQIEYLNRPFVNKYAA